MKQLWPPIDSIERQLFEPSDELIRRWTDDPSSLDAELVEQLQANALAREKHESYLSAKAAGGLETIDPDTIRPRQMPSELFSLLQRRQQSADAGFPRTPRPGQVRLVGELIGPDGPTGIDLATPLAVLLVEPTGHPSVWYGYGVSSETDYAGYWDMILEDDVDTPFDPMAGMIQVWNPTYLFLSSGCEGILAQLSDSRMGALRSLAREYLLGEDTDPADADPGVHTIRNIGGHRILTGSPLAGRDDPRVRYQQLYQATFETVGAIARDLALELEEADSLTGAIGADSPSLVAQLGENIRSWADKFNQSWGPAPELALAMSEQSFGESRYCLNDQLLFQLVERTIRDTSLVEVHLTLIGEDPLTITPIEDTIELPAHELTQEAPKTVISFAVNSQGELAVTGNNLTLSIPITPLSPA